jgi:signal transduction histidine kinase
VTEDPARRLAVSVGIVGLALLLASLALLILDWKAIDSPVTAQSVFIGAPIIGALGVLIAARRPKNPIGWLLLAIATSGALYLTAGLVAMRGLLNGTSPRSWVEWPAWVFNNGGFLAATLILFLILFFPDGRLLSPRWRVTGWLVFAAATLTLVSGMIALPAIQLSPRLPMVPSPLAVPSLDGLTNGDGTVQSALFFIIFVVLVVAVVARYRRSRGVERQQMRWFAFVAAAALGIFILTFFPPVSNAGTEVDKLTLDFGLAVVLPMTIGLAVMKNGLYDLDVVISRTLVYGSLAVFVTAVYVGIAVGLGTLVGSGGKPNLALSIVATAIVALGFQPVRERVQKIANRLVFGKRATPYEVLSQFSSRVAETYAGEEVLSRMARVLQEGTGAEAATVWLRGGDELRPAATEPNGAPGYEPQAMQNGSLPEIPGSTRTVAVRHQNEILGALSIVKRRGESLTPLEQKLLDDLAHQAGLVLRNVGLTADLQARLEELRLSRQRLVSAQDEERRRLERNLHDGAQQHLVALTVKLGLAEMLLTRDAEKAKAILVQLKATPTRPSTPCATWPGASTRRCSPTRGSPPPWRPRPARPPSRSASRRRASAATRRTSKRRCTSAAWRRSRTCRSTRQRRR